MADDISITGAGEYIQFGYEAVAFATEAAAIAEAFGHDQKFSINRNHNLIPIYECGNRDVVKMAAGPFEGRITVDFTMASTYFMKAVMGTAASTGSGPYTHTYSDNTGDVVTSITIEHGLNLDTDNVYKYLGCVVDSAEITYSIGSDVKVRLNFLYAKETKATSGFDATPATDAETPFTYANATFEMPNATTVNRVQSFTLTISLNVGMLYGVNSRVGTQAVWRNRKWDFIMTVSEEHDDWIEDAYGAATAPLPNTNPAGEASCELTITNSEATTAERSLAILLTTTHLTQDDMSVDVANVQFHNWTGYAFAPTSVLGIDNTNKFP